MSTFKDIVMHFQQDQTSNEPNFYTYNELIEQLNQQPNTKISNLDENLFDFVNVNIYKIMCMVNDIKENLEAYGIMNDFEVKDMIDIIYECVQVQEVFDESSEDENDLEDDDPLDIV